MGWVVFGLGVARRPLAGREVLARHSPPSPAAWHRGERAGQQELARISARRALRCARGLIGRLPDGRGGTWGEGGREGPGWHARRDAARALAPAQSRLCATPTGLNTRHCVHGAARARTCLCAARPVAPGVRRGCPPARRSARARSSRAILCPGHLAPQKMLRRLDHLDTRWPAARARAGRCAGGARRAECAAAALAAAVVLTDAWSSA